MSTLARRGWKKPLSEKNQNLTKCCFCDIKLLNSMHTVHSNVGRIFTMAAAMPSMFPK